MAKTHGTMDQFEAQVRARISELDPTESVESATNTCGIAAKPDVVKGATYYVDTQGMLGEPGQQYDYDQLWEIWDDNHEDDPVMDEYDSFDYWLRDTVKWFDVIQADTSLDSIPDELTVTIEGSTLDDIDECDDPIMSGSILYGEYGQMLIDDEEALRDQYDEGELAPSEIVESLGYVAQDDHVYIKDLGDGCNMVFDFTKYNMGDDDDYIQHYFTDETGRIPRGYTVTKMYL